MNFTVYCTDCGRPLATTEDTADEDAATCAKCGSLLEYHVRHDTALIRLKTYATMLMPDEKRRFKINCPECGKRLANSADGTDTVSPCPKCGAIIRHEIKSDTAYIKLEKPSEKQPTVKRKTKSLSGG